MSSSINASLTTGINITSDTSGIINLQSGGTTVATISSTGLTSTGGALNGSLGATTPSSVVATTGTFKNASMTNPVTLTGNSVNTTYGLLSFNNVDTAAGTVGIWGGADNDIRYNVPTAGSHIFRTNNVTQATIDASGNVGIGVTPSAWYLSNFVTAQVGASGLFSAKDGNDLRICSNTYLNTSGIYKYLNTAYATRYEQGAGTHAWYTAPSGTAGNTATFTQAMTLDASGYLLIGTTSSAFGTRPNIETRVADGRALGVSNSGTGTATVGLFLNNAGSSVGSITYTTTTTTYATSSDYRLKENIAPMIGALDTIALLKPVTYTWKLDNSNGEGFIAHELAEVYPQAVTGEKDAVDAEGIPQYQGIDTSFLVATLTAAIQEQQALITSLTARLDTQADQIKALQGAK